MSTMYPQDTAIADLIEEEKQLQANTFNFIASENIAYPQVKTALGSAFTNVYAEGYPGKRYYAGCSVSDTLEQHAIDRCKKLFGADHANVQPHSGSQANMAVYYALLQPGDTLLGMSLTSGGHLTHGHPVNFSGVLYNSLTYTVNPQTEYLDYDAVEELVLNHKPRILVVGGSSYSRRIDVARMRALANKVDAYLHVDVAHTAGLIAAGIYPNPMPYADVMTGTTHKTLRGPRGGFIVCKAELREVLDRAVFPGLQGGPAMNVIAGKAIAFEHAGTEWYREYLQQALRCAKKMACCFEQRGYRIVSGGTDCHLFVVDLRAKDITGKEAEQLLESIGILTSRSTIPFDPQNPAISSGLRLGTLYFTAAGYGEDTACELVSLMDEAIMHRQDPNALAEIAEKVQQQKMSRVLLDYANEVTRPEDA